MVLGWRITLTARANEKIMRAIWGWLTGKLWLVGDSRRSLGLLGIAVFSSYL
jgi:hypothetical protein